MSYDALVEPQDPAQVAADAIEAKALTKIRADKATAKQAVLDRLGITADEAELLFG